MSINIQGRTGWNAIPNSIGRSKLPHPTVHLLINLLSHADGFHATYSIITEQTGMSSKTIAAALDNLKKLGIVSVTKVKGMNGRFESNDYDFHPDRLWKLTPELVDERLRGKKPAVGGKGGESDRCTRESGTAVEGKAAPLYEGKTKKYQEERSVENDQSPLTPQGADGASAADEPDRFEEFYEVYDRKKKRPDAERAWKKAIKKAAPQVIIDAAQAFITAQKVANKHPHFTPYPATWLNAESWDDEIDEPQEQIRGGGVENTLEAWGYTETGSTLPWEDPAPTFDDAPFIDAEVY